MASRFNTNSSNRSSSLFAAYDAQHTQSRTASSSPGPGSRPLTNGYAVHPKKNDDVPARSSPAFAAYQGSNPYAYSNGSGAAAAAESGRSSGEGAFRSATPNRRGQYSDAVLSELESQNEEGLGAMSQRVRMLKDLTSAIGDEIRDSSALADTMNNTFENTRVRLKGTMGRMLRMAQKTGVGWKVWVGFFAAVCFLFYYVWLF